MKLAELRHEIDNVDNELLALFLRRMELVREVSLCGEKKNIFDPSRESEIIDRLCAATPQGVEQYTEKLYRCILGCSRQYQAEEAGKEEV